MGIFETFGEGEGKPAQDRTEKTSGSAKQTGRKTAPAFLYIIAFLFPATGVKAIAKCTTAIVVCTINLSTEAPQTRMMLTNIIKYDIFYANKPK